MISKAKKQEQKRKVSMAKMKVQHGIDRLFQEPIQSNSRTKRSTGYIIGKGMGMKIQGQCAQ
jgi:hypothetical protein